MPERLTRADILLAENLRTLISRRRVDAKDVALVCGHGPAWISKILNGDRGMRVKDVGEVASFFGLTAADLFSPGISPLTERRRRTRRTLADRRVAADRRRGAVTDDVTHPSWDQTGGLQRHAVVGEEIPAPALSRAQLDQRITDTIAVLAHLQGLRESSDAATPQAPADGAPQRPTDDRGDAARAPRRHRVKARG